MEAKYSALGKAVTRFEKLDPITTACKSISYHSDQLTSACPVTGQCTTSSYARIVTR